MIQILSCMLSFGRCSHGGAAKASLSETPTPFLRGLRVMENPLAARSYGVAVSVPKGQTASEGEEELNPELHVLPLTSIGDHLQISQTSNFVAPSPSCSSLAERLAVSVTDSELASLNSPLKSLQKPFLSPAVVSPGPQSLSSTSVEGQQYFVKVCRHMRESYVEYAHHMHTEIMHRTKQLKEAEEKLEKEWKRTLEEIAAVETHKNDLQSRLSSVESQGIEIAERIEALTRMVQHAPKELSAAEKQLKTELEALQKVTPT